MGGFLGFQQRFPDEVSCIAWLVAARWPDGMRCQGCGGARTYQLACRPRVLECAGCGKQHSATAGTVFHKTRTPLQIWFWAAYLLGADKRGVSALQFARSFELRYDTAWTMLHKLRHALFERADATLDGLVEVDETYYGGRGRPESRGRSLKNPNKSLIAAAVEKRPAAQRQGDGIKQSRHVAGAVRLAVLPSAGAEPLGSFVRTAVAPGSHVISDGFQGYRDLADRYRHHALVQGEGARADVVLPIVHTLFGNLKTWLNGTFHGVSAKHLPRYLREWAYRFNRRHRQPDMPEFLLRRAARQTTITYRAITAGLQLQGAAPALTG